MICDIFLCVGSMKTTQLLLEAGARTSAENKVGRTATQMAAFVGKSCLGH